MLRPRALRRLRRITRRPGLLGLVEPSQVEDKYFIRPQQTYSNQLGMFDSLLPNKWTILVSAAAGAFLYRKLFCS